MSSDSTSWQITLAKSLSSLRSQLAPCLLESVSALEKQGTSSEPFPRGALAILLFTKLSPIPPNFTNRKQRETNNERCSPCHRHVTILLSIYGAPLLTQGGGQNGSWFIITGVCTSSPWLSSFWDHLSPWRKRYSSLKLSTLPVRVFIFLLYSVLTPVIFYFFREKCAR